jgi:hypothetical protein
MILLDILCIEGLGSLVTKACIIVFPATRSGSSDLSNSSIVLMVFSYLMGISVDNRVDLEPIYLIEICAIVSKEHNPVHFCGKLFIKV